VESPGEESHSAEGMPATAKSTKGRPDDITTSLAWSLVTGERASLPERILDEGEAQGEGRRRGQ